MRAKWLYQNESEFFRDSHMPWQYVLLGFWAFGAIFAVMLIAFTFDASTDMGPYDDRLARWISIPYLLVGLGAMPFLILFGRRRFQKLNPQDEYGAPMHRPPRNKQLVVALITIVGGILVTIASYNIASSTNGFHMISATVILSGVIGIIRALLRSPDDVWTTQGRQIQRGFEPVMPDNNLRLVVTPPPVRGSPVGGASTPTISASVDDNSQL
jgi:peptidoglycan/LPS O-acetylase OafA/YrhL